MEGGVEWNGGLGWMEENKKSGGGDVRAKAFSWDIEWKKAKNVFFGFFPLSPTVARCARHSHPSPPEKKAASRKKSRLRRKKTAPAAKNGASCVSRVAYPYRMVSRHNRPPRLFHSGFAVSKLRFGFASLAWRTTIRHLRWLVCASRQFDEFVT